jgi:hypothetical protein
MQQLVVDKIEQWFSEMNAEFPEDRGECDETTISYTIM